MNRIDALFARLGAAREKALVGFLTAGDPDFERGLAVARAAVAAGLDILEVGLPFSDPTADGPAIQAASRRALDAGMTLPRTLAFIEALRRDHPDLPLVLFSYYNPVFRHGAAAFHRDATAAGADGVLLVDLPPEESDELTGVWPDESLHLIRLVAPTTTPARVEALRGRARGFVYAISRVGVTGTALALDTAAIGAYVRRVRQQLGVPVCVGFGISTPADVRALAPAADGVVVGSALVRQIAETPDDPALPERIASTVRALRAALTSPGGECPAGA